MELNYYTYAELNNKIKDIEKGNYTGIKTASIATTVDNKTGKIAAYVNDAYIKALEDYKLEQYKITFDGHNLYHDNELLSYNIIKEKIQDSNKFVFCYYSSVYMIPAFVNETSDAYIGEAIEFSTTYQIDDKVVNYRIIINEDNDVRMSNKTLVDDSRIYGDNKRETLAKWEEDTSNKQVPYMGLFKNTVDELNDRIDEEILDRQAQDEFLLEKITDLSNQLSQEHQDRVSADTVINNRLQTIEASIQNIYNLLNRR